jgi:hypothetical protein
LVGEWRRAFALCGIIALILAGSHLSIYAVRGIREPLAPDTASYVRRANCVAASPDLGALVLLWPGGGGIAVALLLFRRR